MQPEATDLIASLPLRESPAQSRSRDTVLRLLEAARVLVAEDGVAALTTGAVAESTGVPIGTVYRYFRDRDGLVDALVAQDRFEMDAMLLEQTRRVQLWEWRQGIRDIIAAMAHFARTRPGYLELRSLARANARRDADSWDRWVNGVATSPAVLAAGVEPALARRATRVAISAIQGNIPQLYQVEASEMEALVDETAHMVALYVVDVAARSGITLP